MVVDNQLIRFYELIKLNKTQEAEIEIVKLLSSDPQDPLFYNAYFDLSICYLRLEKFDEAIISLKEFIKYNPENPEAYNNLGLAYLQSENIENAIFYFNKCIELRADFVQAYNNLGIALYKNKKFNESIYILEHGLKLDPRFHFLYFNLARSFKGKGDYLSAVNILKNHLVNKDDYNYLSLLGLCLIEIGEISEGLNYIDQSLKLQPNSLNNIITKLLHHNLEESINLESYSQDVQKLIEIFSKEKIQSFVFKKPIETNNLIKVGFISADFRNHAVSHQIYDVVKNLSLNKDFELYAYFNNEEEDSITKTFKPLFKSWKIVKHLSDPILTETIRSDKIEILVDLSGYTNGNRIRVLFNKAAPIQVSWCGYLASTGVKQIDYIIADKNVILENEEGKYSEKVYKLGKIWTVLRKDHNIFPDITIPAIKNNYITFGSFNNIKKINKKVIKIWSEILCSVPNSKLHLISERFNELDFIKYFKRLFFNHGVDYNNLIFEPTKNRVDFLNKYNSIDIALDPFPYAGGTTTLESYWMCVPVLTKTGNYFLSKTSESINQSIGMQEWICANESDYIKKAINFSKDFNSLQKTRNYLIKNRENFIIFNSEDLANELSKAFKDMISIYNNTQKIQKC